MSCHHSDQIGICNRGVYNDIDLGHCLHDSTGQSAPSLFSFCNGLVVLIFGDYYITTPVTPTPPPPPPPPQKKKKKKERKIPLFFPFPLYYFHHVITCDLRATHLDVGTVLVVVAVVLSAPGDALDLLRLQAQEVDLREIGDLRLLKGRQLAPVELEGL